MANEIVRSVETIVDWAAKRVGRQPDLEARRNTIREAIAEALELTSRSRLGVEPMRTAAKERVDGGGS